MVIKNIDDTLTFYAQTCNPSTGAAADIDAAGAPTYRVYEEETGTAILTGSMALLDDSNTVGLYSEQISLSVPNGFENGKCYCIRIAGAVDSVSGADILQFGVGLSKVNVTQWNAVAIGTANVLIDGGITAAKIATDAIAAAKIADGALTAAKFGTAFITSSAFAAGAITATAIASSAFAAAKFASDFWTTILSTLGLAAGNLDTQLTAIKSDTAATLVDTNELQTDWANGGRLDNILDARASQTSVDTIDGIVDQIIVDTGTTIPDAIEEARKQTAGTESLIADASPAAGGFDTNRTEANGFWNDQEVLFTSGALIGQAKVITSYLQASGAMTFDEPFTAAPANGDGFVIGPRHVHPVSQIQSGLATAVELAKVHKQGETRRYTQVAADDGDKTADVSLGAPL